MSIFVLACAAMSDLQHMLEAARHFGITDAKGVSVLTAGLMHKTFKIESSSGDFILQKLHTLISSEAVLRDGINVTEHLRAKGFYAPRAVRTVTGGMVHGIDDHIYRGYTFISGQTITVAKNPQEIHEAGKIVGRFHEAMRDFPHAFESDLLLHQSRAICERLIATLSAHTNHPLMTDEVRALGSIITETLPTLYLPETLPKRHVHFDLKISNILFDSERRAISIIDFDTCNHMPLPLEMGDAFRSWCGDEEERLDNVFSLQRFKAGWEGYVSTAGHLMTDAERAHIVQGILLITLELAARFLTDYFDDAYFGWNKDRYSSRRDHNLARARGQRALFESLLEQREAAEAIVRG